MVGDGEDDDEVGGDVAMEIDEERNKNCSLPADTLRICH